MTTSFKLLGNCQVCGRTQAVNRGISKHGYTVKHGWFQGVCQGEGELPLQQDDTVAKRVIAGIKAEIVELTTLVDGLKSGIITPLTVKSTVYKGEPIPFAEASSSAQRSAVDVAIYNNEHRIRAGNQHIEFLTELAERVRGQELVKEIKQDKAPYISRGEKKLGSRGRVLTVTRNEGARIYWIDDAGFKSWTGSAAWRKLENA